MIRAIIFTLLGVLTMTVNAHNLSRDEAQIRSALNSFSSTLR